MVDINLDYLIIYVIGVFSGLWLAKRTKWTRGQRYNKQIDKMIIKD